MAIVFDGQVVARLLAQNGATFERMKGQVASRLAGQRFATCAVVPAFRSLPLEKQCGCAEAERAQLEHLGDLPALPALMDLQSLAQALKWEDLYSKKGGPHIRRQVVDVVLAALLEDPADLNLCVGWNSYSPGLEFSSQREFLTSLGLGRLKLASSGSSPSPPPPVVSEPCPPPPSPWSFSRHAASGPLPQSPALPASEPCPPPPPPFGFSGPAASRPPPPPSSHPASEQCPQSLPPPSTSASAAPWQFPPLPPPVACELCLPASWSALAPEFCSPPSPLRPPPESRPLFQSLLATELRQQVPRQPPLSASQASVRSLPLAAGRRQSLQPLLVVSGPCKSLQPPAVSEARSLSLPRPSAACSVLAAAESVDVMAAVSKRLSIVCRLGPCSVQSSADLDVYLDEGLELAEADSLVGVVVFVDGCDGGEYPLERLPARTVASLRSVGGFQRGSSRIPVL